MASRGIVSAPVGKGKWRGRSQTYCSLHWSGGARLVLPGGDTRFIVA